jgi:hypothetical protein
LRFAQVAGDVVAAGEDFAHFGRFTNGLMSRRVPFIVRSRN